MTTDADRHLAGRNYHSRWETSPRVGLGPEFSPRFLESQFKKAKRFAIIISGDLESVAPQLRDIEEMML